MIKLVIAGGRNFNNYELLEKEALMYVSELQKTDIVQVVSGGAKGVDSMGERFAKENNLEVKIFLANWTKFGRSAGPKRNAEMAEYASHLLSFWDGESKGTKSMINLAKKNGLKIKVVSI